MTYDCIHTDLGHRIYGVDAQEWITPPFESECEAWMRATHILGGRLSGLIRVIHEELETFGETK